MRRFRSLACLALLPSLFAASPGGLKDPCTGLMIRDYKPATDPGFIDNVVVLVPWSDLESAPGHFDGPGWARIDQARKKGFAIRLRILAGVNAPAFVKRIGGPGISDPEHHIDCSASGGIAFWSKNDRRGGSFPRFWLPEALDCYERLMTEVARRYEDAPEIREVVASGAMTHYAEPFYRAHSDPGDNLRLFQAGLTFEKDKAAHRRVIEIHRRLFQRTRTSLAINSWDIIDESPSHHRVSFEPTYEFVEWARSLMGERLVLQNNGMGGDANPLEGTARTNHFAYLKQAAQPKGFQSRTLARLGGNREGLTKAIDIALSMGASFVELPSGYDRVADERTLRRYDRALKANGKR